MLIFFLVFTKKVIKNQKQHKILVCIAKIKNLKTATKKALLEILILMNNLEKVFK